MASPERPWPSSTLPRLKGRTGLCGPSASPPCTTAPPWGGPLRARAIPKRHAEISRVPEHRHTAQPGCDLLEKIQALGREFCGDVRDAREMAARVRQIINQARADRIAGSGYHGRQCGALLDREGRGIADGHDHIDVAGHQVCDEVRQLIDVSLRPASLEG